MFYIAKSAAGFIPRAFFVVSFICIFLFANTAHAVISSPSGVTDWMNQDPDFSGAGVQGSTDDWMGDNPTDNSDIDPQEIIENTPRQGSFTTEQCLQAVCNMTVDNYRKTTVGLPNVPEDGACQVYSACTNNPLPKSVQICQSYAKASQQGIPLDAVAIVPAIAGAGTGTKGVAAVGGAIIGAVTGSQLYQYIFDGKGNSVCTASQTTPETDDSCKIQPHRDDCNCELLETYALGEARGKGTAIPVTVRDTPRLVATYGEGLWNKYTYVKYTIKGMIEVHYYRNENTGQEVEFKIKKSECRSE